MKDENILQLDHLDMEKPSVDLKEEMDKVNLLRNQIKDEATKYVEEFDMVNFEFGNREILEKALVFLTEDAKWKFSEALYLTGAISDIDIILNDEKEIYGLPNRILDTLNFFLSKVEGDGIYTGLSETDFDSFVDLFKATQNALKSTEKYRKEMKHFEKKMEIANHMLQSWQHGIDPGNQVEEYEKTYREENPE